MPQQQLANFIDLGGRVVVVAGAGGGGMGTAIVRMAAQAGATVLAVDRSSESLDSHVAPLIAQGRAIIPVIQDIMTDEGIAAVIERARAADGDLFGLVTVVGGTPDPHWGDATRLTRAGWNEVLALNLDSMVFISRAFAAELKAQRKPGSLVSISSISGLTANPFQVTYGAAKAAVISVVQTMALELAASGIRVNTVAPGAIATPAAEIAPDRERDRRVVPMARQGRPQEVAGAVLYLLSDMASYTTGQCLVIDGGLSLKWSHLDEDNIPAYITDETFRARLKGE